MRIEINDSMQRQLGLVGLDSRYMDVKLHDGSVLKKLVIREGWCITGRAGDANGEGHLPFQASDIKKIRRHSFLSFW